MSSEILVNENLTSLPFQSQFWYIILNDRKTNIIQYYLTYFHMIWEW